MLSNDELSVRLKQIKLLIMDVDGVLTDGRLYLNREGCENRTFHYQDIMGISRLKKNGVEIALVSGEEDVIIDNFAKKLKIEKIFKGCREKDKALKELAGHYGIGLGNICFIGDDINDIPAFKIAGLAVGVPDGWEGIKGHVHFITKKSGGRGAVREVCEMIISNARTDTNINTN